MFTRFYKYLPVILIIFLVGCQMSSTSNIIKTNNDKNKASMTISGSKQTGIQMNN